MNAHWPEPDRRELLVAGAAGIIWALLGLTLLAHGAEFPCEASDSLPLEERAGEGGEAGTRVAQFPSSSCRITNHLPGGVINLGSGTLIDVSADLQRGLILTCAHLFTEGTGTIIVAFPGRPTHGARLLALDKSADLAALTIARPPIAPSALALEIAPADILTACGFGATGEFRAITAPIVGTAQSSGQVSLQLRGAVRSGDSGGGVFDSSGRLVAVAWGEAGGVTYASTGAPLRSFLERIAGRATSRLPAISQQQPATLAACPGGRCPLVAPDQFCPTPSAPGSAVGAPLFNGQLFANSLSAPPASSPSTPLAPKGSCSCGCDQDYAALVAKLDALDRAKQDRGEFLAPTALDAYARKDQLTQLAAEGLTRHDALLERLEALGPLLGTAGRAAAPFAISALGISGPAGWGILAAAAVGSWFLGRRLKGRGAGRETPVGQAPKLAPSAAQPATIPTEATAAAVEGFPGSSSNAGNFSTTHIETHAPIERDDREARELLRLSQLEGRDPLQDALAGRLALDRLDALAESDGDPARARLADDLRRELRERFNEIAPTKFEVTLPRSS
jgi:hypothetical protein